MTEDFYIPERAVAIFAHADDIEFGIAGTIARWTDAGAKVTYVIVTDNSSGDNSPDADLKALVETRKREAEESARIVGVEDVRILNYRDGYVQPTMELRLDLTRIIREIKPQVVVTFDPTTILASDNYINHPDHRAVGEAATYATFPYAGARPIFPELLAEGYEPHDVDRIYFQLSEKNNLHIDISSVIDRKLEALRVHKSQLNDEVVEMVRKWNEEAGKEHGVGYVESFRQMVLNHELAMQEEERKRAAQTQAAQEV